MKHEVQHSPGAGRQIRSLRDQPAFAASLARALDILENDPYNRTGHHAILELTAAPRQQPQFRLRVRRYRFRYIVVDARKIVLLLYVSLRREDTYR